MKKLFIAASLLIGMIAGAMMLSSFSEPKQEENNEYTALVLNKPSYWEGQACMIPTNGNYLQIVVYQAENQCNAYYAVVKKDNSEKWVKINPGYDSSMARTDNNARNEKNYYQYFITYNGSDYYFNMR